DNDIEGEISGYGTNPSLDDHPEQGTGQHGAILADVTGSHPFSRNRIALDIHDAPGGSNPTHPSGGGVEIGDPDGSPIQGNVFYLRVRNLTTHVNRQTGGNAFQAWGSSKVEADIKYLYANNITGVPVQTRVSDASGIVVEYGRATNFGLWPYTSGPAWDTSAGAVYQNVQPAP